MGFEVDGAVIAHYALGVERDRLATWARLEAARTWELLERYLPPAPADVLDIGGAEGAYALPLARAGYRVRLLDLIPGHVDEARSASDRQPGHPLAGADVGDARELPYPDASADAVLLLGPLYHLVDVADRRRALGECRRVLRPGGRLLAAGISRFASAMDGVRCGYLDEPEFEQTVLDDLRDGVHRNPDPEGRPDWFTLAYFHRPEELAAELAAAGFADVTVHAVEGIGALCPDVATALDDPVRRQNLLRTIRRLESEPALLGASPHLLASALSRL
jgi:ubiquinone/menaquinone biosynthesis C-methylase UbiE